MRPLHTLLPRGRGARLLFASLLMGALFMVPAYSPLTTTAAGNIVQTENLSETDRQSEAPQIATAAGRVAATWSERASNTSGLFGYTATTLDSSFPRADISNVGLDARYQWADVVIDPSGTSHLVYSTGPGEGGRVYYQRRTPAGGRSTIQVGTGNFPNSARIARAPSGRLWVIWRNNDGSLLLYKFSDNNGDTWVNGSDGGVVASDNNMVGIDIAVDFNNVPYVFWYVLGSGTGKGEIRYATFSGVRFTRTVLTTDGAGLFDADPVATTDGNGTIHVAWRKLVSPAPNERWTINHIQKPNGGDWTGFEPVATVNGNPGFSPAIGADAQGNVHITYTELLGSNSRRVILYSKIGGTWQGPLDLKVPGRRFDTRSAVAGSSSTGVEAHVVIQSELGRDDGEIIYRRVQFSSPLGATPVLDSNDATTNGPQINLSFTNVSGGPTEVRWRWNAPPTDAQNDSVGWQPWGQNGSRTISPPNIDTANSCVPITLYTQVRKDINTVQAGSSSDSIVLDRNVQAQVQALNPYMSGLTQNFTLGTADAYDAANPTRLGAFDGDPNYTRAPQFFLTIYNTNDCSGLKSFTVPASNVSGTISGNRVERTVTLPQGSILNPGSKVIGVAVQDGLDTNRNFGPTLIYDPGDTNASPTVTNTAGLPVLNGGSVSADSNTQNVIRTLTFSGVDVDDTTYGQFEGLPPGRQFWGVWIANSPGTDVGANSPSLKWFPVRVPTPQAGFTVQWSLFTGLAPAQRQAGNYYVYVRFLDGAGNATVASLKTSQPVVLDSDFRLGQTFAPIIRKP